MSGNGHKPLAPQHAKLLVDSAITADVQADRGYWTATKGIELQRLGFSNVQAIVPSLVISLYSLDGEVVGYQHRPDTPRVVDGRALKYESPAGTPPVLDVPPRYRDEIRRGTGPVWITEGSRKADAATSLDLYCVSISGVWSWLHSKDNTVLPDLLRISWDGRQAVIAFDSDVMVNPSVHAALEKLAKWLESQGAGVHCLYLPNGDAKLGLDDAIAAGYTTDRLWEYVEPGVRPFKAEPKGTVLPTATLLHDLTRYLRRYVRFADERARQEY